MTVSTPLGKPDAKHKGVLIWDKEDADRFNLSGLNLSIAEQRRKNIPSRYAVTFRSGYKQRKYLHNFIMWSPDGFDIDHINKNPLDNRKCNLRIVSRGQNNANGTRINKHGHRGIHFASGDRNKPWCAEIKHNKTKKHLGYFLTKDEAIEARKIAEKSLYPEIFN